MNDDTGQEKSRKHCSSENTLTSTKTQGWQLVIFGIPSWVISRYYAPKKSFFVLILYVLYLDCPYSQTAKSSWDWKWTGHMLCGCIAISSWMKHTSTLLGTSSSCMLRISSTMMQICWVNTATCCILCWVKSSTLDSQNTSDIADSCSHPSRQLQNMQL